MKNIDNIINQLDLSPSKVATFKKMTESEAAETEVITQNVSYKKKYSEALKVCALLDVPAYFQTHPEASAKEVLVEILKEYDDDVPSEVLFDMTKFILSKWKILQATQKELVLA